MSALVWDQTGQKKYETGIEQCALFVQSDEGTYPKGVAWNGVTKFSEAPSGAEPTKIYADNQKYLELLSAEEFGGTLSAYMYPDEFEQCDGSAEIADGVTVGQQERKPFGLAYKTIVGNDVKKNNFGYKLHLVYGCLAKPSSMEYSTVNDSTEVPEMSWEVSTTPVAVAGLKPTATLVIDSTKCDTDKLKKIEAIIYGSEDKDAELPLPDAIAAIFKETAAQEPQG